MSGHYRMHRGWMDNPALGGAREAFCRRAAWCWMIERAAWKAVRENVGGKTISLERGQLTASLRYMADAWGWSVSAVRRFIERLEEDAMIGTATSAGQMVITICNYSKYQADAENVGLQPAQLPNSERSKTGTATGTATGTVKPAENKAFADDVGTATGTATGTQPAQDRHSNRHKRERSKEGNIREVGDSRAPAHEAGTAPDLSPHPEARTVVAHFHQLRGEGWPTEDKLPAPELTLLHQASTVLADLPLATVLAVMTAEHRRATDAGTKRAPHSLKAFDYAFNRARTAAARTGDTNHEQRNYSNRGRYAPYDPEESRRRSLAAHARAVGREQRNG